MNDPLSSSGIVIVDKPAGMTSHDIVARLRRIFSTRRVGHAGTLDPMATGVLVVGIERGTKFLAHMVAETKTYRATIRLGMSTSTDDAEGETLTQTSAISLTDAAIDAEIQKLTGNIMQRPSAVSAIKIAGKRAYERVRAGEKVDIPARPVTVHRFDVLGRKRSGDFYDLDVEIHCSSGTYIRSLARDLGAVLGVGGHLISLRRTAVGPFTLEHAQSLEALQDHPKMSLTLDAALQTTHPVLPITEEEGRNLAMGKWLEPKGIRGIHAAITPDGKAIALVKEQGKRLSTVFVARPSTL
ncbi:tRNA pseudouridine(55) synthase TruB [Corynebacterium freiburgense]|uniref:tRNA pseudouridine(55) synthase TruB n=1 Tax=Corynebacterium freiburgense TaxID=556548 RepID=UPI0004061B7C|nr:tRNA pseudouridine(55) synthase TruB [Corynebacterium freiburgense]WJZ02951.1 tRNA pseudouridine synthase B [Corynebacterium freiburgense]